MKGLTVKKIIKLINEKVGNFMTTDPCDGPVRDVDFSGVQIKTSCKGPEFRRKQEHAEKYFSEATKFHKELEDKGLEPKGILPLKIFLDLCKVLGNLVCFDSFEEGNKVKANLNAAHDFFVEGISPFITGVLSFLIVWGFLGFKLEHFWICASFLAGGICFGLVFGNTPKSPFYLIGGIGYAYPLLVLGARVDIFIALKDGTDPLGFTGRLLFALLLFCCGLALHFGVSKPLFKMFVKKNPGLFFKNMDKEKFASLLWPPSYYAKSIPVQFNFNNEGFSNSLKVLYEKGSFDFCLAAHPNIIHYLDFEFVQTAVDKTAYGIYGIIYTTKKIKDDAPESEGITMVAIFDYTLGIHEIHQGKIQRWVDEYDVSENILDNPPEND